MPNGLPYPQVNTGVATGDNTGDQGQVPFTKVNFSLYQFIQNPAEDANSVVPAVWGFLPGRVERYGADPLGRADSTAAIVTANLVSKSVTFTPGGTYLVTNLVLTGVTNTSWTGAGIGGVTITTETTGNMVSFGAGCNFNSIEGFTFTPTGSLAGSVGLYLGPGSGNTTVRKNIFQNWTTSGAQCVGTSGAPISGHNVSENFFNNNSVGSSVGQLHSYYSEDWIVSKNTCGNGGNGASGPFPAFGMTFQNSSNGEYSGNKIYYNQQAEQWTSCGYNRKYSNRAEQSQNDAVIYTSCEHFAINNNWHNYNGQAANNTYKDTRFIGSSHMTYGGNHHFSWNGGAPPYVKNAVSVESSSSNLTLTGNDASPSPNGYATAAWAFDSSIGPNSMNTDGALQFSSGANVAANTTTFLGQQAANSNESFASQYITKNHTVVQLVIEAGAVPGAGQSFTYTLYKDGVSTGLIVTLSGTGGFQLSANASTAIEDVANQSYYTVQLVTSSGAAVTNHFAQVIYCAK